MDSELPVAEAVVTKGSRIVYVGDKAGALKHQRWYSSVIDLNGKTLMPGFVDAHSHFLATGLSSVLVDLNSSPAGSIDSLEQMYQAIGDVASRHPPGEWIVGFNYDNTRFPSASHPDRLALDAVAGDNPVYVRHHSGHMGVGNTLALQQLLQLKTDSSKDELLTMGHIDTAAYSQHQLAGLGMYPGSRRLSGLLQEKMAPPMSRFLKNLSWPGYWRVFRQASDTYLRFGYTTVQEGSAGSEETTVLAWLSKLGVLPMRVNVWMSAEKIAPAAKVFEGNPVRTAFFKADTVKIIADGSPQGATAYLSQPYFNDARSRGVSLHSQVELARLVSRFWQEGFRVAVHANGDAAIENVINAIEILRRKLSLPSAAALETATDSGTTESEKKVSISPVVLVHAQTIRSDQLDRLEALEISPSFFSSHSWYWGDWHRQQTLGEQRASMISPTGTAAKLELEFTIHTDAPVTSPDPWKLLWITTQRLTRSGVLLGAAERIDRLEGLKAMTINAAKQAGLHNSVGSISNGKRADLIVVNESPLQVDDVRQLLVVESVVNGVSIYQR